MPSSESSGMFCYVYVLQSTKTGKHYVGFTHNLRRRLAEHNAGKSQSTRSGEHWEVIFYEAYRVESDARRRENYLKTSGGKRALRTMIKDYRTSGVRVQKEYYSV